MHKRKGSQAEEMGKRGSGALHGAMNVMSSLLLCLTFGRLLVVLYGAGFATRSSSPAGNNRVPEWLPSPPQPGKADPLMQQPDNLPRPATSQRTAAYVAGRRGEAMPAELQQLSNNLRASAAGDAHAFGNSLRSVTRLDDRESSSSSGSHRGVVGSNSGGVSSTTYAWGQGMRVLIFTMDSIQDVVARSTRGGPAGEIIVRESLTQTLIEAGAQVCGVNNISRPRLLLLTSP